MKSNYELAIDALHEMNYYFDPELVAAMDLGYAVSKNLPETNPIFKNVEYLKIYRARHPDYGKPEPPAYTNSQLAEVRDILKAFGLTWDKFMDYVTSYMWHYGMYYFSDGSYSKDIPPGKKPIGVIAEKWDGKNYICSTNWRYTYVKRWEKEVGHFDTITQSNEYDLQKEFEAFSSLGSKAGDWSCPKEKLLSQIMHSSCYKLIMTQLGLYNFERTLCTYRLGQFGYYSGAEYRDFSHHFAFNHSDLKVLFLPVMRIPKQKYGDW